MIKNKKIVLGVLNITAITTTVTVVSSCDMFDSKRLHGDPADAGMRTRDIFNPGDRTIPNKKNLELDLLWGKVQHPNVSTKSVANKIHDVATLKSELGVDLSYLVKHGYKIKVLSKLSEDSEDSIYISITATNSSDDKVITADWTITNRPRIDFIKDSVSFTKNAVWAGKVAHPELKASEIANKIHDIETLKSELGVDLSKISKYFDYKVSAVGSADGVIKLSITMKNKSLNEQGVAIAEFKHKTDQVIDSKRKQDADFKKAKRKIQQLLKAGNVVDKTQEAWYVANSITDIETLKQALGVDLASLSQQINFLDVSADGDPDTGIINVEIRGRDVETDQFFYISQNIQHYSNKEIVVRDFKKTETKQVIASLKTGKVVHTNLKASEIAKRIVSVRTLEEELGIQLNVYHMIFANLPSSAYDITVSATADSKGKIIVSVSFDGHPEWSAGGMESFIATVPISVTVSVQHVDDSVIDRQNKTKADKLTQEKDFALLKQSLKGANIKHPTLSASVIASKIVDAQTLKNELGVDLSNLNATSTYAISATSNASGIITTTIEMTTNGVTQKLSHSFGVNHVPDNSSGNTIVLTDDDLKSKITLAEINIWLLRSLTNSNQSKFYDFSQITKIPANAFNKLAQLPNNINFSNKLTVIGERAFENLVELPENINFSGVEEIGGNAFYSLGKNPFDPKIELPKNIDFSSLKIIGESAFRQLSHLPDNIDFSNVTEIGDYAFEELVVLPKRFTLPNVNIIGDSAFRGLTNLPDDIDLSNLKEIKDEAFYRLNTLPDNIDLSSLTTIGWGTFHWLRELPENIDFSTLTSIGDSAFWSLEKLPDNIDLSNVTKIGGAAFSMLKHLPDNMDFSSLLEIEEDTFRTLISLPDNVNFLSVTSIGENAFGELTTIPNTINFASLTTIGKLAFKNVTLLSENIDFSTVTSIGEEAFRSLQHSPNAIDFSSLEIIGKKAFKNLLNLNKGVDFSSVTSIDEGAFWELKVLDNINFSNLRTIGADAFFKLKKLPNNFDLSNVTLMEPGAFHSLTQIPRNIKINKHLLSLHAFNKSIQKVIDAMLMGRP